MKICPVGAELFHADGQTRRHMTKLTAAFRNFGNAPKTSATTSQRTQRTTIRKTNPYMLYGEIIVAYYQKHGET
jgi:hypothetical protein